MGLRAELHLTTSDASLHFEHVHAYEYKDRVGELFELVVEVGSKDEVMHMASLLRRAADFESREEPGGLRVQGIVKSCEQLSSVPSGLSRYRITVVPELWVLTQNLQRRIFQEKEVSLTTRLLLGETGMTGPVQVRASLVEAHDPAPHRTQYDESDFAFLQRILTEEGIVFWLGRVPGETELEGDKPALFLHDDTSLIESTLSLPFRPAAVGAMSNDPSLRARGFERGAASVPERGTSLDNDYKRPALRLEGKRARLVNRGAESSEVFDYRVTQPPGDMDLRALRFLEARQGATARTQITTNGTIRPGTGLTLTEYPGGDVELLAVAVRTRVAQRDEQTAVERQHEVEAVWRPLRIRLQPPPRPRAGLQSAVVVGAGEIDTDAEGSVLVRFAWDRRPAREQGEKRTSRRVRVAQAWAGPGMGTVALPRVGDEVLISFLEDDPDSPIVIGRLHNGQNRPQLSLPAAQTRTSWKSRTSPGGALFNEILFEDLAEQEAIEISAGRDMRRTTGRDESHFVGRDLTVRVDGKQVHSVAKGTETRVLGGSTTIITGGGRIEAEPDLTLKSSAITITGQTVRTNAFHAFLNAGGYYIDTTDVTQVNSGHFNVYAKDKIYLTCGGASITMEGGNITIAAPGTVSINGNPVLLNCE